jgi:hypothetical protein
MSQLHFVPQRPGHLRGRDEELAEIARLLDQSDTAIAPALSGQGGIGKTQLAVLYAHQYGDRHPKGVFWLSMADTAGSPSILLDRFASLARVVDLKPDGQSVVAHAVPMVATVAMRSSD